MFQNNRTTIETISPLLSLKYNRILFFIYI
nr:MAG TPA: hypothetical protein [Caudoviricetes sp.]